MHFEHSGEIWRDFPQLVPGVLFAEGITAGVSAGSRAATFTAVARSSMTLKLYMICCAWKGPRDFAGCAQRGCRGTT